MATGHNVMMDLQRFAERSIRALPQPRAGCPGQRFDFRLARAAAVHSGTWLAVATVRNADAATRQSQCNDSRRFRKELSMSTRQAIQDYFGRLANKRDWSSLLADEIRFTSHTSPTKRVNGKTAYLEATKRFFA